MYTVNKFITLLSIAIETQAHIKHLRVLPRVLLQPEKSSDHLRQLVFDYEQVAGHG